jgi:5-formyltetrahydrofolate cyclo-ligase
LLARRAKPNKMPASSHKIVKAALREEALSRRNAASAEVASALANRLATVGMDIALSVKPRWISAYYAIRNEPSTLPLLEKLAAAGFSTALPVTGARDTALVFRAWSPGDPTLQGKMGICEPLPEAPEVDPDLLFVPLAAFDRTGNRIGYGAGFYDRTLAKLRAAKPVRAVGIAFACQEIAEVPEEGHDERLDFVLTEKELIECRA